jgi:hypothetical protein
MNFSLWVLVLCSLFLTCKATNYTWQATSTGGDWGDSSNWLPAGVPGVGDTAQFTESTCQGITDDGPDCPVSLGSPITIAGLIISDTGNKLALAGNLTVTTYTYMEGFTFSNLTLVTKGYTQYVEFFFIILYSLLQSFELH